MQKEFLEKLVKDKTQVSIYLVSGIKLSGTVTAYDDYTIELSGGSNGPQLVFKHAVSTVMPIKPKTETDGNR